MMGIWGQCPECGLWFSCANWFDQSSPVPCCPACRLAPVVLRYQHDQVGSLDQHLTSDAWLG